MKIEELLTRYFDGETSREEERDLRRFFTDGRETPEELQLYRPLFAYLDEEVNQQTANRSRVKEIPGKRRYLTYVLSGIAAGLLLILGITGINKHFSNEADSYVIIDGKRYTDVCLARQQAQAAFDDVSFSKEEVFETLFSE